MIRSYLYLGLSLLMFFSCSRTVYVDSHHVIDNKYDSEFPNVPTSDYLEEISEAVKLVNIMVSYRVYTLPVEAQLTKNDIDEDLIKDLSINETYISSPASGTATIIFNSNNRIALLSCAHIFNFPDTITVNYTDEQGEILPFIQNVYYKIEQNITIPGLPEVTDYEILVSDIERDIAVIGKLFTDQKMMLNGPFRYPKGKARELRQGTFVYIFGYPRGVRMVSRAIVGQANKDNYHNFIMDAAMHNGVSGGPVFALRDGAPNFEMVGMVFAIAGEMMQFLGPDESIFYDAYKNNKYYGDVYLKSTRQIVYGITYALSMEVIEKFFVDNYNAFSKKGYNSKLFLKRLSN